MATDLLSSFSTLEDPRVERNKRHTLEDIIFLTISASLSGAEGWEAIETFGHTCETWLKQYIKLANGIPSHDCIARLISRIPSESLSACFIEWTQGIADRLPSEVVAIDGKTIRGSHDRNTGLAAIHMVNAWATKTGLALGQVKTEAKSNEITAIPKLLNMLEIKGCIISIDAMGCQTKIASTIIKKGADYVLAVKKNQPELYGAIEDFFEQLPAEDVPAYLMDQVQRWDEIDGGHGRVEERHYSQSTCLSTLPTPKRWKGLISIGMVETKRNLNGKTSSERRYYISSLSLNAKQFGQTIRSHWGVENSLHWVLDMTLREDDSRIRKGHAPANCSIFRQVALNLLKQEPSKLSIKRKRFKAALSDQFRSKIIFGRHS